MMFKVRYFLVFASSIAFAETIVGNWVIDPAVPNHSDVANSDGLQTSDLTFDAKTGLWWSISDQNATITQPVSAQCSGFLYRLKFGEGETSAERVPIVWSNQKLYESVYATSHEKCESYIDFEGLASVPDIENTFLACTEGSEPWLIELGLDKNQAAIVLAAAKIRVDETILVNESWEGIAILDNMIYLARQTASTEPNAHIYTLPLGEFRSKQKKELEAEFNVEVAPTKLEIKDVQGPITGICAFKISDRGYLALLRRDVNEIVPCPERLKLDPKKPSVYLVKIESGVVSKHVELDLRGPTDIRLLSASPEGIATDRKTLQIIGDPWGPAYCRLDCVKEPNLENLTPLVFAMPLENIVNAP